jgi:hypothetical protein
MYRSLSTTRRQHQSKIKNRGGRKSTIPFLLDPLEPRLLLTSSYIPTYLEGPWSLAGLSSSGNLAFDDVSALTAGTWTSSDGATHLLVTGTNSTFAITPTGSVNLSLESALPNATVSSLIPLTGLITGTRDFLALYETADSTPAPGGLTLLVNHAAAYTIADLAGTWSIAGADFRGAVTLDALGHVTAGTLTRESNQHSAAISAGTATLNANGTGTLAVSTRFTDDDADLATLAFTISLNAAKDTLLAANANIGQPQSPSGTGLAHLTLLVKSAGTYARADAALAPWTIASSLGTGTLAFSNSGNLSGNLLATDGTPWTLSGTYALSSTGAATLTLTASHAGTTQHFTFTGAMNRAKNLIALDRSAANADADSSLFLLVNATNHAPTELSSALWPSPAYHASNITIDFPHLLAAAGINDLDNDPLSILITDVPAESGTLWITHGPLTSAVVPGATSMVAGDTLTWTPSISADGPVHAFSVLASDGTVSAANPTDLLVDTHPIALVSAKATIPLALETKAGTHLGDGKIQIARSGGDQSQPLTVTLTIAGTAQRGTHFRLLAPDGVTELTVDSPTIIIPAGKASVTLTVTPLEDHVVDPTLTVLVSVANDPNTTSSAYAPALISTATVSVLDGSPIITVKPYARSIKEGAANVRAFTVTRAAAKGGNLAGTLTVGLAFSGTFNTASHFTAPAAITFLPGQTSKTIILSTTDDGIAEDTMTLIATPTGDGFFSNGPATLNVLDASPIVTVVATRNYALEANPAKFPGRFTIRRTGSTAAPLTVDFATASGGIFGTLGTNYALADAAGNPLTNAITIPARAGSATITLTPIDDGANDPTLQATLTLQPDAVPTYHVGTAGQATVAIRNLDRAPTVSQTTAAQTTTVNTALTLTHSQLAVLMGAALAAGETHGILQLKVSAVTAGTLQIQYAAGGAAVIATPGTLINAGDTLIWTPPAGAHDLTYNAFTLVAQDGTVASALATRFRVAVS